MITFVFAAAVLVGAVCVAAALDGATCQDRLLLTSSSFTSAFQPPAGLRGSGHELRRIIGAPPSPSGSRWSASYAPRCRSERGDTYVDPSLGRAGHRSHVRGDKDYLVIVVIGSDCMRQEQALVELLRRSEDRNADWKAFHVEQMAAKLPRARMRRC